MDVFSLATVTCPILPGGWLRGDMRRELNSTFSVRRELYQDVCVDV